MIKIENVDVVGWEHAIRGMRNPKNSWDKSDSGWFSSEDDMGPNYAQYNNHCDPAELYFVGPNDHKLMMSLAKGGPVHAKYRRMIMVYMDITAPLYWWKEFDTYKVGTVANSCSTMHKIHAKEFELSDFSHEHLFGVGSIEGMYYSQIAEEEFTSGDVLHTVIEALNTYRKRYLETKDKKYWWQMIQLLPSSYNQKRTVMVSYEVLYNAYHSRENHKLDEWREGFCDMVENLPYSEIITMEDSEQ